MTYKKSSRPRTTKAAPRRKPGAIAESLENRALFTTCTVDTFVDPQAASNVSISPKPPSLGHNLISRVHANSSGWDPSDLTGADSHPLDPKLSPLDNYGGSTQTFVPLSTSPARGTGSASLIPSGTSTDQRGFPRIVGGKVDIGAVQLNNSVLTATAPPNQSDIAGVAKMMRLGSFTDAGGKGPFTLHVNWGDGSPIQHIVTASAGAAPSLPHKFINTGTLHATISVTDALGDLSNFAKFAVVSAGAPPRTIVVNTAADRIDPPGSATVSFPDAVAMINGSFGPVTVKFDPTVFTKGVTYTGAIALRNPFGKISIAGPAAGITVKGGLSVDNPGAAISHFTVTGGDDSGVTNYGTLDLSHCIITANRGLNGGGIDNAGTMTVSDCVISSNFTTFQLIPDPRSSPTQLGGTGGIENDGNMSVTDSTITDNGGANVTNNGTLDIARCLVFGARQVNGPYLPVNGDGIDNFGAFSARDCTIAGNDDTGLFIGNFEPPVSTTAVLTNTTICDNKTAGVVNRGMLRMNGCTVTHNAFVTGELDEGGILNGGDASLANSIIAANATENAGVVLTTDVFGTFQSLGHNLIGQIDQNSTGWISSDITGTPTVPVDARLSPLGSFGGAIPTVIPLAGSPALDAGSVGLIPANVTTDERGQPRTFGGKVDIGAVEVLRPATVAITPPGKLVARAAGPISVPFGSISDSSGAGPFVVNVQWGDGSPDTVFTVFAEGKIPSRNHTFFKIGAFTGSISVTDSAGSLSNLATFPITVLPERTIVVNTPADQIDPPHSATMSLRDAIALANSATTPVTIAFDPLVFNTGIAMTLTLGDLNFNNRFSSLITLAAPAAPLSIGMNVGVISISTGTSVTMNRLIIKGGSPSGVIMCQGNLQLNNCDVLDSPGGVRNFGTTSLVNCTLARDGGVSGSALFNAGVMSVIGCTIAFNFGNPGVDGVGIFNAAGAALSIGNSIVTENSFLLDPDVNGQVTSLGHNLIGNNSGSSGWIATDLMEFLKIDPRLDYLGYHGGKIPVFPLLAGSPAIDAGDNALIPPGDLTDERGQPRINKGIVDIGAYET